MADATTIIDMFNELSDTKKSEVIDFIRFMKYQEAKDRILTSNQEERLTFNSVEELMQAIDDAD
ncbi:MAG: hypothetical protein HQL05_00625 [Nitrospirae bacterium]|uniref:hypothetical protein n=1 Tax=Candidatus Magnetobacterium casense TaxID=1455061 RepID=UPI00058FEB85|nr:hypothetical protein [Candidatus Magnetobacterium casensis]MBF0336311.1 hypothetical protein [Nitrospirota bacterium]